MLTLIRTHYFAFFVIFFCIQNHKKILNLHKIKKWNNNRNAWRALSLPRTTSNAITISIIYSERVEELLYKQHNNNSSTCAFNCSLYTLFRSKNNSVAVAVIIGPYTQTQTYSRAHTHQNCRIQFIPSNNKKQRKQIQSVFELWFLFEFYLDIK